MLLYATVGESLHLQSAESLMRVNGIAEPFLYLNCISNLRVTLWLALNRA